MKGWLRKPAASFDGEQDGSFICYYKPSSIGVFKPKPHTRNSDLDPFIISQPFAQRSCCNVAVLVCECPAQGLNLLCDFVNKACHSLSPIHWLPYTDLGMCSQKLHLSVNPTM